MAEFYKKREHKKIANERGRMVGEAEQLRQIPFCFRKNSAPTDCYIYVAVIKASEDTCSLQKYRKWPSRTPREATSLLISICQY